MGKRDTLEYGQEFGSMPADWTTRASAAVYQEGQYGRADDSASWCYDGALICGVRPDPATPGKYLCGHVAGPVMSPFGFWEARVQFGTAPGVLFGWWLQSEPPYQTEKHTEVDIAENSGNPNIHSTIWLRPEGAPWGTFRKVPDPHITTDLGAGPDEPQADWHRYGCRVTPTGYTFYIDNAATGTVHDGLTDTPKFPIFSVKIPDYLIDSLDPDNLKNNRMKVAWIRKYAPSSAGVHQ